MDISVNTGYYTWFFIDGSCLVANVFFNSYYIFIRTFMYTRRKVSQVGLFLTFYFFVNASIAQTTFDEMRKVPVLSPEVASLTKMVELPVSYFSGRSDVSVPLYTVNSGDIVLPISLTYNSGGVKVSEEASWVGLGWALNAGGVISHEIRGANDDNALQSFNTIFPFTTNNGFSESFSAINKVAAEGIYDNNGNMYTNSQVFTQLSSQLDGEPDLYVYNFGKFSGKFLWLSSTEIVDLTGNNVRFSKTANGIVAISPDGFEYEFSAIEMTVSTPAPAKTAYFLTKVTSASKNSITLTYKTFREYIYPPSGSSASSDYVGIQNAFANVDYVRQIPSMSEEYIAYQTTAVGSNSSGPPQNQGLNRNFSTSEIRTLYLDRITFNNGYVQFNHGSRKDLFGIKLEGFKVYNNYNSVVKDVRFQFDYFTARKGYESYTTSGNGYKVPYDESYRKKRLKLKGVTVGPDSYKFQYYEGADGFTLPYKSSFEQDYWGYYNGATGNTTLVPDFRRYNFLSSIPLALSAWIGANRDATLGTAIEGSLKKIQYPTAGFSEFIYDMHEFGNAPSSTISGHRQVAALNTGPGVTVTYMDLQSDTYADIYVQLFCNKPADAEPSGAGWDCGCVFPPSCNFQNMANSMYTMIERIDPVSNQSISTQWQYDFGKEIVKNSKGNLVINNAFFPAGRYKLTANYPDNKVGEIGNRMAYLYINVPEASSTGYAKGGGIRISSIKTFDPATSQYSTKEFKYEQGLMMKFPRYYSSLDNISGLGSTSLQYTTHTLYSNAAYPSSLSANGSPVGYAKVTESYTGEAVGKTEYHYIVKPDKLSVVHPVPNHQLDYIPGTPSTAYLDNGFLSKIMVYNNTGSVLKTTSNTPRIDHGKTYWAFKKRIISEGQYWENTFAGYVHLTFYPIQQGKLKIGSTREEFYEGNNATSIVKEFDYNERGYLKKEMTTASGGKVLTSLYTYPTDYASGTSWIDKLKAKNIIEKPLEVLTKIDDKVVEGNFVMYQEHDDMISPSVFYKVEALAPITASSTAPSGYIPSEFKIKGTVKYDGSGNIKYTQATDGPIVAYKWGYNNQYQIGRCENATDQEFFLEDFEGNGNVSANTLESHTGTGAFSGTLNLSNYFSSSQNGRAYRLSYFKNAGSGSEWIYLDVPYTGQSISGLVDDIRIYPKDALVTTFTYEPLVGITSTIDPKGMTTFYKYDDAKRLVSILNHDGKVIKSYRYNYVYSSGNESSFSNIAISQFFTKQCSIGTGSREVYTVPAGKYFASSQDDANAMAQAEIAENGQTWADVHGSCSLYVGPPKLISVLNGPGSDLIVNYEGPSGANFLLLYLKDVATGQVIAPVSLSLTETSYKASVSKGKQYDVWLTAGGQRYSSAMNSQVIRVTLP